MQIDQTPYLGAAQSRPIPPLPGGGSWTFDETARKWISNDPTPAPEARAPAEQSAAAEQTTFEA